MRLIDQIREATENPMVAVVKRAIQVVKKADLEGVADRALEKAVRTGPHKIKTGRLDRKREDERYSDRDGEIIYVDIEWPSRVSVSGQGVIRDIVDWASWQIYDNLRNDVSRKKVEALSEKPDRVRRIVAQALDKRAWQKAFDQATRGWSGELNAPDLERRLLEEVGDASWVEHDSNTEGEITFNVEYVEPEGFNITGAKAKVTRVEPDRVDFQYALRLEVTGMLVKWPGERYPN